MSMGCPVVIATTRASTRPASSTRSRVCLVCVRWAECRLSLLIWVSIPPFKRKRGKIYAKQNLSEKVPFYDKEIYSKDIVIGITILIVEWVFV